MRIAGKAKYRARGAFLKGAFSWEKIRPFPPADLHLDSRGGWLELKETAPWWSTVVVREPDIRLSGKKWKGTKQA